MIEGNGFLTSIPAGILKKKNPTYQKLALSLVITFNQHQLIMLSHL